MFSYNAMGKKDEIIGILDGLINQIENVASGIQNEAATLGGHTCAGQLRNMAAHYRDVRNIVRNTRITTPDS
ncbi:MAG: hypothetical protein IJD02_02590 [Lachnospiraceae bacterium]|nr:hypothetical protein [Lachnospiraceae bacterium]